jgi:hypothetical protein
MTETLSHHKKMRAASLMQFLWDWHLHPVLPQILEGNMGNTLVLAMVEQHTDEGRQYSKLFGTMRSRLVLRFWDHSRTMKR